MNKESLATILGAAILGLAKSKMGNRNEEKPWINFISYQPKSYWDAEIDFSLSVSAERPTTYTDADIENFRYYLKRKVLDDNNFLDDDDENKQDWEEVDDVPDWHVDDVVEEFDYKPLMNVFEGVDNFVKWYKEYYET